MSAPLKTEIVSSGLKDALGGGSCASVEEMVPRDVTITTAAQLPSLRFIASPHCGDADCGFRGPVPQWFGGHECDICGRRAKLLINWLLK